MNTSPTPEAFLRALLAQDFTTLSGTLDQQVQLRALLPSDYCEWSGREVVAGRFAHWFGGSPLTTIAGVTDAVGPRSHLSWQLSIDHDRLGSGPHVIRQDAYVDVDPVNNSITRISLVCSGFHPVTQDRTVPAAVATQVQP